MGFLANTSIQDLGMKIRAKAKRSSPQHKHHKNRYLKFTSVLFQLFIQNEVTDMHTSRWVVVFQKDFASNQTYPFDPIVVSAPQATHYSDECIL